MWVKISRYPTIQPKQMMGIPALATWGLVRPVQSLYSKSKLALLVRVLFNARCDTNYKVLRREGEDTIFRVTVDSDIAGLNPIHTGKTYRWGGTQFLPRAQPHTYGENAS